MTTTHFRLETDADGVAPSPADRPGLSDERADGRSCRRIGEARRQDLNRPCDQRRRHHLWQGRLLGRRRSYNDEDNGRRIRPPREGRGQAGCDARLRGWRPALSVGPPSARDVRQACCGRDQRGLHGGRLRTGPRLPLSHRVRQRQGARRAARGSKLASFREAAERSEFRG